MKTLRLFVLVLLAVLMPLRGVSAAAPRCDTPPASHTAHAAVEAHDHDALATPGHQHASDDHGHHGFDKAGHCVSSCSAPPLMAALPTVPAPPLLGTAVFPHVVAPAPTFQSDGLDRPPRRS